MNFEILYKFIAAIALIIVLSVFANKVEAQNTYKPLWEVSVLDCRGNVHKNRYTGTMYMFKSLYGETKRICVIDMKLRRII